VLLVDQFVHLALRYTARAYVLEKGEVILEGESDELAQSPDLLAAYLGESLPGQEPSPNGQADTEIDRFVAQHSTEECLDAAAEGRFDVDDLLAAEQRGPAREELLRRLRGAASRRTRETL
jgi:hypothetical protein